MDKYKEIVSLWKFFVIENISGLDKYLSNFRILFAYNSGKIENEEINLHDTREIFENGKVLNFILTIFIKIIKNIEACKYIII